MLRILLFLMLVPLMNQTLARERSEWETDILSDTFSYTEATPSDYPWSELIQACPKRDCIPSIDKPLFIPAAEDNFLSDDDIVIAVEVAGEARAYPIRILVRHELVNDTIAGHEILVSYCPLCGSGLVFDRNLDGAPVEFGVSGLLHNSDLVMYDRKTASLWQQITGTAFAGAKRKQVLETIPSSMTTWSIWRSAHPNTNVLSTETGLPDGSYDHWPYGDYAKSDRLMFPVSLSDARLHPKMVVYGADIEGHPVAYTQRYLREKITVTDNVADKTLTVTYGKDGGVIIRQATSGKSWVAHRLFWFAWYSFHPDTLLRRGIIDE
jgi:hypothetical protein